MTKHTPERSWGEIAEDLCATMDDAMVEIDRLREINAELLEALKVAQADFCEGTCQSASDYTEDKAHLDRLHFEECNNMRHAIAKAEGTDQ